jgi:hypothetical protein
MTIEGAFWYRNRVAVVDGGLVVKRWCSRERLWKGLWDLEM